MEEEAHSFIELMESQCVQMFIPKMLTLNETDLIGHTLTKCMMMNSKFYSYSTRIIRNLILGHFGIILLFQSYLFPHLHFWLFNFDTLLHRQHCQYIDNEGVMQERERGTFSAMEHNAPNIVKAPQSPRAIGVATMFPCWKVKGHAYTSREIVSRWLTVSARTGARAKKGQEWTNTTKFRWWLALNSEMKERERLWICFVRVLISYADVRWDLALPLDGDTWRVDNVPCFVMLTCDLLNTCFWFFFWHFSSLWKC